MTTVMHSGKMRQYSLIQLSIEVCLEIDNIKSDDENTVILLYRKVCLCMKGDIAVTCAISLDK